ncbi:MAG: TIGR03915 family putative DNA repair protein [Anaerovoracaceae bacterium]
MVDYLYDGTFEGLLTAIYHHYYKEKAWGIYHKDIYQSTMLGGYEEVETDPEKAMVVYSAIKNKISPYDLQRIYKVYLSTVENKETKILNYARLGFKRGGIISRLHGDPIVFPVQEAEKKVNNEVHRLSGLIRFSLLENQVLYSPVEPDHDVLELIAEHFCDRFKSEPFIIHDTKRSKALIAYENKWYISTFTKENLPKLAEEEKNYTSLWKVYFKNIAIKERTNPRCQKNMMPVRYWKNLTEFQL